MKRLNLFYEEPDNDRWFAYDRYPRRFFRRIVRGRPRIGGQKRVFVNLCAGLDRIGVKYRVNDYKCAASHPNEFACIIGKPHVLDKQRWKNPIVFGAAIYSHPIERPTLLTEFPNIRKILVPGEWMRKMYEPYYGDKVVVWPVGIDTQRWVPNSAEDKRFDFLIYDKVRWEHHRYENELIGPIRRELQKRSKTFATIRYGEYREQEYQCLLKRSRAMIFLCEHETQGIAYQQGLSCGVPILAWDRGGYWQDPAFYPARVKFSPVTSVPYWDERCGMKFDSAADFVQRFDEFLGRHDRNELRPRDYIMENLTLEKCAQRYLRILEESSS